MHCGKKELNWREMLIYLLFRRDVEDTLLCLYTFRTLGGGTTQVHLTWGSFSCFLRRKLWSGLAPFLLLLLLIFWYNWFDFEYTNLYEVKRHLWIVNKYECVLHDVWRGVHVKVNLIVYFCVFRIMSPFLSRGVSYPALMGSMYNFGGPIKMSRTNV